MRGGDVTIPPDSSREHKKQIPTKDGIAQSFARSNQCEQAEQCSARPKAMAKPCMSA